MNVKQRACLPTQRKIVFLTRYAAAVSMLALAANISCAQELAPVIDAGSNAWVNSLAGGEPVAANTGGSVMQTSALGCSSGALGPGIAAMGLGSGTNCNYGAPLWAGACQECGCLGCAGGCSGGACGGGSCAGGKGGLFGGFAPMRCGAGGCGAGRRSGSGLPAIFGGSGCRGGCSGGPDCCCVPCGPPKRKRLDIWAEYIYLRPRNAEVAYGVPIDGPITPTLGNGIQIGPTGIVEMNHKGNYRFGFNCYGPNCTGITFQWTRYESHADDGINIGAPDVIRSLVTHPLGTNAASDGLQATADLDIDFDLADLAFRMPWKKGCRWCTEVLWGVRYGRLNQQFASSIDFNGTTTVNTDIDFDGVGPRIGLLAQRRIGCKGLFYAYSQGDASFLVGSFDADYTQRDTFAGLVVDNSWDSGRVVPQLDYELGIGIMTPGGKFRIRTGYIISAWFNTVRTNEFINSVQTNNQDGLGDGITFDGLVFRTELRF